MDSSPCLWPVDTSFSSSPLTVVSRHFSSCLPHSHLAVTYRHFLSSLTVASGHFTSPDCGQWRLTSPDCGQWRPTSPDCGQWRPTSPDCGQWHFTSPDCGQWRPTSPDCGQWHFTSPDCGQWALLFLLSPDCGRHGRGWTLTIQSELFTTYVTVSSIAVLIQ